MDDSIENLLRQKPALDPPDDYANAILDAGLLVDRLLTFDLRSAIPAAEAELQLLRDAEGASGRRLHKGHPLHNLGVAWFPTRPELARRHFMAAHAEDIRLWPRRRPRGWNFLALRMLRSLFDETRSVILRLEKLARRQPGTDPLRVADDVIRGTPLPDVPARIENYLDENLLDGIAADRRVFVGGSYPLALDRIDVIEAAVREAQYEPVIVNQYRTISGDTPRTKSFRLLDKCSAAAFEGSGRADPGWWPELEHIVQVRPIPTLVAFFGRKGATMETSSMFPTVLDLPELITQPWVNHRHLHDIVIWWLRNKIAGLGAEAPTSSATAESDFDALDELSISNAVVPSGSLFGLAGSNTRYIFKPERSSTRGRVGGE